jgi:hypothetical protein
MVHVGDELTSVMDDSGFEAIQTSLASSSVQELWLAFLGADAVPPVAAAVSALRQDRKKKRPAECPSKSMASTNSVLQDRTLFQSAAVDITPEKNVNAVVKNTFIELRLADLEQDPLARSDPTPMLKWMRSPANSEKPAVQVAKEKESRTSVNTSSMGEVSPASKSFNSMPHFDTLDLRDFDLAHEDASLDSLPLPRCTETCHPPLLPRSPAYVKIAGGGIADVRDNMESASPGMMQHSDIFSTSPSPTKQWNSSVESIEQNRPQSIGSLPPLWTASVNQLPGVAVPPKSQRPFLALESALGFDQEPCHISRVEESSNTALNTQATGTRNGHIVSSMILTTSFSATARDTKVSASSCAAQKPAFEREHSPKGLVDWYCPRCCDLQFRKKQNCRICGLSRDQGVTLIQDLDVNRFLEGHCIEQATAEQFWGLTTELQHIVMSGGSLHGARNPTAVLCNRIRKAHELALQRMNSSDKDIAVPNMQCSPQPVLAFDRKNKSSLRQRPAGMALK